MWNADRPIAVPVALHSIKKRCLMMRKKRNLTKILMCCAVALLILLSAAFCGMTRADDGVLSAFSFHRPPLYQDDWRLVLVNGDCALPKGFATSLLTLSNGEQVDERIYPDLQRMFDDARAAGLSPFVRAGYRSTEDQERIMENRVDALLREGWPEKAARKEARRTVAWPGHSEHELGLAVDINSHTPEEGQLYAWLAEYAWQYGFILRYPQGAEEITGIDFEPWHFRYVGADAARAIREAGCTLEEYLGAA